MHHLGIGRAHARKRVLAFADDHHVTVADLTTGEVLSLHQIEPDQDLLAQPKQRARPMAELHEAETYDPTHHETHVPRHHKRAREDSNL